MRRELPTEIFGLGNGLAGVYSGLSGTELFDEAGGSFACERYGVAGMEADRPCLNSALRHEVGLVG